MNSQIDYGTQHTQIDSPIHLTPNECRRAVQMGHFSFEGQTINVTMNVPVVTSYYRFGYLDKDFNCGHSSFTSNGRYFKSKMFIIQNLKYGFFKKIFL